MMLEGEVILKGQGTDQQELLPVMLDSGDKVLTFDEWLSLALPSNKGIKLDFRTIEPVELCLQKLAARSSLVSIITVVRLEMVLGEKILPSPLFQS